VPHGDWKLSREKEITLTWRSEHRWRRKKNISVQLGFSPAGGKGEPTLERAKSSRANSGRFLLDQEAKHRQKNSTEKNWLALGEPNKKNSRENKLMNKIQILNCSTKIKAIFL
jgi:hypothetical protein